MSVVVALAWWFGMSLAAGVVLGRLLERMGRATTTAPVPVKITTSPTAR